MEGSRQSIILIAEDEPSVRKLNATILEEAGYEVLQAENGKEAVSISKMLGNSIDLILSDLRMPLMNGEELAEYNSKNKNLPFVVFSAISDAKLALKLMDFGVQDYLVKPVSEEKLLLTVKNGIGRFLEKKLNIKPDLLEGNVGTVTVDSKRQNIFILIEWVREQVSKALPKGELTCFLSRLSEIIFNAYEHGNLGVGEEEKGRLITKGTFLEELKRREKNSTAKITLSISVLNNEIALKVCDDGTGFDYNKYLEMDEDEVLSRLEMPNGKGILIVKNYFDSIEYSRGGATVQLYKKLVGGDTKR